MQTFAKKFYTAVTLFICLGFGAGFLSAWILDTFSLGLALTGVTKYALVYYFTCLVISTAILVKSKAARMVGIFMALYPFGLVMIFMSGFSTTLRDPQVPNTLGDQFAVMQTLMAQASVWFIPAVVTGYYLFKAFRETRQARA